MKKILLLSFLFLVPFIGEAFAANTTAYNSTLNDLDGFFNSTKNQSAFYFVFFLVTLFIFELCTFTMKNKQYASVFSIAAVSLSVILALFVLAPFDFVYVSNQTKIHVEEIAWLDGNYTINTSLDKNEDISVLVPYDAQLRLIMSGLFGILGIFNGLYAILILTKQA